MSDYEIKQRYMRRSEKVGQKKTEKNKANQQERKTDRWKTINVFA